MSRNSQIAIVGLGGIFPEARDLDQFWELIRDGGCASRDVPEGRWILRPEDAYDPRKGAEDKVYSLKGCFIEGFDFDPKGLALSEDFLAKLDPVYHLALHASRQAFAGAKTKQLDRSRVGVVIGNIALPTDSSSALSREMLRSSFLEKAFGETAPSPERSIDPINRYVAGLPAGLIAKALRLGGGTFTLDAACASSLYAIKLAVDELLEGRADMMITGGVSRPDCLYTQMGFSQLRALSRSGRPSPFDVSADGLVVGEGAGMFCLKRLADAREAGDTIHGVITGIGLSNDVGGSLLAPNSVGQLRAMRAAYRQAGWSPSQVDYVECHATGTPTGDPIEVASLKTLWGARGWSQGQCALGSVKSNIGHLLTAAGSAGLMKILLGFKNATLPPSANFKDPSPRIGFEGSPFRVQTEASFWNPREEGTPRRAAVSAFGFGGINAHVLVEEYLPGRRAPKRAKKAAAPSPVAVVGLAARFGPWSDLRSFQERVLGGDSGGHETPKTDPGRAGAHPRAGYFLPEASSAPAAFKIPPKEIEEMLPQQLVMLETAAAALKDAGFGEDWDDRDRAGVFIGLGLDLNTNNFNFRWALIDEARRRAQLKGWALSEEEEKEWVSRLRDAGGPALSANRTMGALGSVAASRIAREFNIGGPSFTISSEESSGMKALEVAVRALQRGELDSALVGAVDIAGDIRSLESTHAGRPFSGSGTARPLDRAADGTIPGEGAAAVVLKRLEDAVRDGDRVYSIIKGIGSASGGGGEDYIPTTAAYVHALRRAYADAAVDPSTVSYLETHGSGFPAEDAMESDALCEYFGTASIKLPCALGSVKAHVGHTGAASGLASLIKTSLALYQDILPPLENHSSPNTRLARGHKRFHVPRDPQFWLRNRAEGPRRAAVSSFSMDGNCLHVVLEGSESPRTARAAERRQPLGARNQGLFIIGGRDAAELAAALGSFKKWFAEQDSQTGIEFLARRWWIKAGGPGDALAASLVGRDWAEMMKLIDQAEMSVKSHPDRPVHGERFFYSPSPLAQSGSVAFVFPGSGNQFLGMGRDLWVHFPEIQRALDTENGFLRGQMVPELYAPWQMDWTGEWRNKAEAAVLHDYQSMIFASVSHGAAMSDLVRSLGVEPKSIIGYSLGETAGLFATRAWTARDEMLRRMRESSLFVSDLAGPCDAARRFWNLPNDERVDWVLGVIDRPADNVRRALKGMNRAALLIVNAPLECVVGGYKKAVENLVDGLGAVFLPLQGVSTVHFEAAKLVEKKYRDLHLFPTSAPKGISYYSGAWGKVYELTRETAADSIVTQAIKSIDFAALISRAYDDGVRLFIEMGPQASCTRMIGKILGEKPHMVRSLCFRGQDQVGTLLKVLGHLAAEGVRPDLKVLYGGSSFASGHQERPEPGARINVPLSLGPVARIDWAPAAQEPQTPAPAPLSPQPAAPAPPASTPQLSSPASLPAPARPAVPTAGTPSAAMSDGLVAALSKAQTAKAKAHGIFLRMAEGFSVDQPRNIAFQEALQKAAGVETPLTMPQETPRALNKAQCLEYATGSIAKVLGERYAHVDALPTRVRLPAPPLMLVDRILKIEGEPQSMTSGRVVTEHDVEPGAWYLDAGRIPTCIAVEAGQADLFLSGYLGIDTITKGLQVYRLLDAEITFHGPLPAAGSVIRYDIKIERFSKQGESQIFFFNFESTVNGKPLLSMRNGCAGFFNAEELGRGRGIVMSVIDKKPMPRSYPADWVPLAPLTAAESYDDRAVDALRTGDLAACFGDLFSGMTLGPSMRLPSGRMKLVDRVLELEPGGGRYGLGRIKAEADIHPDDWHLTCHFPDDNVMPGTLMYECCMHTLRIYLQRMGWVGTEDGPAYEPVPGVTGRLKCRGQVLASTKKVAYEVEIKEIGYKDGTPYAVADALMYADGRPIVRMNDMSLRLSGIKRETIESLWAGRSSSPQSGAAKEVLYDEKSILAFAVGKPSEAFGDRYKIFDEGRVIARLPGPPYDLMHRVTAIRGAKPWVLEAGGEIDSEYDVPADAWYFKSDRQPVMPFAILLEIALQPCGWFAGYLGSALTSSEDLSFRNLGGKSTLYREVRPDCGTLRTKIKMTRVSQSAGMIIQNYDMEMRDSQGLVYKGDTYFGFFSKGALADQVGIRGAKLYTPSTEELSRSVKPDCGGKYLRLPEPMLKMFDSVETYIPDGGPKGLGFLKGIKDVDPDEWFFKAHFYQDPVCPGSLGLESFQQLLKVYARNRWKPAAGEWFEPMMLGLEHSWVYRGQVIPQDKKVSVLVCVTEVSDDEKLVRADGFLIVDGRVIYEMKGFGIRVRKG